MRLKRIYTAVFLFVAFFSLILMILGSFSAQITKEKCESLGLPIFFIETSKGKKINSKTEYRKATFSLENFDSSKNRLTGECKIRGHGNTTWQTRELYKKPYLLKLNEPLELLGMNKSEKWILLANTADKTSLRNYYAEYLAKNIFDKEAWIPSSKFVFLFLNGKFEGLYTLTEKVEQAPGKIELTGDGSFLAVVNSRMNKEWNFRSTRQVPFSIRKEFEGLSQTEQEKIYKTYQSKIQQIEDVIFSENFKNPETGYRKFLDMPSFVDWYIINEFTKNHDAKFQSSCYMTYHENLDRLFMGPVWDFDISCGNISWDNCQNPEGEFINANNWYKRLFEDEYFRNLVYQRWNEKSAELANSFEWIQNQANLIYPAIILNDSVWKNIGHRQWPHAPGWRKRKTYQSEIDYMVSFLEKRQFWLNEKYNTEEMKKTLQ